MHQIEKKYLLLNSVEALIDDLELPKQKISEFYTQIKVCKEIKYSKVDSKYYKTIKTGIAGSKALNITQVSKARYRKKQADAIGKKISKSRYLISHDNKDEKYAIDIFSHGLKNIYILEVDFQNQSQKLKFKLPEIFRDLLIKEVSNDERYQNKNLALLGDPEKNIYNIYSIFKDIELGRILDVRSVIFPEMKTSDSVRIALYKLFINLKISHDQIVLSDADQGLDAFRTALAKSRILLDEYKNIFDKNIVIKVKSHLKLMKSALSNEKDLQFIKNELLQLKEIIDPIEMKALVADIDTRIAAEQHKIAKFFTTREFSIIFKQYELLLKENNRSFMSIDGQTSIENSLNYKLMMNYKHAIMICEKYEGCEDKQSFDTIKRSLKILKTLLSEFEMVLSTKRVKEMYSSSAKVIKCINQLDALEKKRLTVKTYIQNLKSKPVSYENMLKSVEKESTRVFKEKSELLKISIENLKSKKQLFKQ